MEKLDKEQRRKARKKVRSCNIRRLYDALAHTSMRELLDRVNQGKSIVEPPREHHVLPPDGEDLDDFETGTEEILDIVDAQIIQEQTEKQIAEYKKTLSEKKKEEEKAKFDAAVEKELALRLSKERSDPEPR